MALKYYQDITYWKEKGLEKMLEFQPDYKIEKEQKDKKTEIKKAYKLPKIKKSK